MAAGCIGFKENLVLSLKESWTEVDLRQLLIEKDGEGEGVSYHSRDCKGELSRDKCRKISSFCDIWFHNIFFKNGQKTKDESGILQDRAENSQSEEESEESSCSKVFDGERNSDEQNDFVERDESQLGASKSKHQAARFAVNQLESYG